MTTTAFVSGATGFLAAHIIKQLLAKGFKVVGSVRSTAKGDELKQSIGSDLFQYEVVEHLEDEGAFNKALKKHPEITVFFHAASPVVFNVADNEKDVILPAVNGTVNVLKAIKKDAPQIKKVIITASIVSISSPGEDKTVDESLVSNVTWEQGKENSQLAYPASKTFAEKAAWKFLEDEKPNFSISTIHPVYIFGSQAFGILKASKLNATNAILSKYAELGKNDEIPPILGLFIHVDDVAEAHIIAYEKDDSAGKRIILTNERFNQQLILNSLNKQYPQLNGNIPKGTPADADTISPSTINDSWSRKYLGIKYKTFDQTVKDVFDQYFESRK